MHQLLGLLGVLAIKVHQRGQRLLDDPALLFRERPRQQTPGPPVRPLRVRRAPFGKRAGRQPPEHLRERVARYADPLPFWYPPLEIEATDLARYPLAAITQRPMAMYHAWDSQNAWLRQIHTHNYLFVNPRTAQAAGIADGGWMWIESQWGRVRCMARYSEAVGPSMVWFSATMPPKAETGSVRSARW